MGALGALVRRVRRRDGARPINRVFDASGPIPRGKRPKVIASLLE